MLVEWQVPVLGFAHYGLAAADGAFRINQVGRAEDVYKRQAYGFADGRPTIKSHLGLFAELTTTDALRRAAAATQEKLYICLLYTSKWKEKKNKSDNTIK